MNNYNQDDNIPDWLDYCLNGEHFSVNDWNTDFTDEEVYITDVITTEKLTITRAHIYYQNEISETIYLIEDGEYITKVVFFVEYDGDCGSRSVSVAKYYPKEYEKCLKYIEALKAKAAETK